MATIPASQVDGQAALTPTIKTFFIGPAVVGTHITGATTNPTFGTAASNILSIVQVGRFGFVDLEMVLTSAGTAGTGGLYYFKLPPGMTIDTAYMTLNASGSLGDGLCGRMTVVGSSSETGFDAIAETTNLIRFRSAGSANFAPAATANFSSPTLRLGMQLKLPIVEFGLTEYTVTGAGVSTTLPSLVPGGIDSGTHATNWSGPFASTAGNIPYVRNGKQVTLMLPRVRVTGNNTASAISSLTALPVSLRPVAGIQGFILVTDANTDQNTPGSYSINTAGGIQISKTVSAGNFTATATTVGFYEMSVSYTTA